eukprot:768020-Hanusia_phi.AAC.3
MARFNVGVTGYRTAAVRSSVPRDPIGSGIAGPAAAGSPCSVSSRIRQNQLSGVTGTVAPACELVP